MKKILTLAVATALTTTAFANTAGEGLTKQHSTAELKAMDCASLAVEKSNAKRNLEAADKNIAAAATQTPGKSLSKWAGMAGSALSAFGGNSEKASKAGQIANSVAGEEDKSDAANIPLQQQIKATAQANIDNIAVYQGSKKCKI